MTIVRSCPAVSTSTPCCSTRPLCALHPAYIHEWSYDVIHVKVNGDTGSDLGLVLGQNSIASWPIGTESASLSNMGRSVPELFPALVWSIERLITSGYGLNANLGIIIWTGLFVCSFSTFKLVNTHSFHIPSSKSLTIIFLLGAGYSILFIRSSPCYSPGICLLSFQYQNRMQLKL